MSKFEAVSTGNLANTPIKLSSTHMSPTEKSAFESGASEEETAPIAEPTLWETVSDEHWSDKRLGEAIANKFQRVTRRMPVPGGHLYAVATYAMTYVRGVSDSSITETMQFVPELAATAKATTKK